jgi:hypothetical protein
MISDIDLQLLRLVIGWPARVHGNHPRCVLVDERDVLLEAENTVITERDCTGHAGST